MGRRNILDICDELVTDALPYKIQLYLVVGWQRGLGAFDFALRVRDDDGKIVVDDKPEKIVASPNGTTNEVFPITFEFKSYGTFLIEGLLDGEPNFTTRLRLVVSEPQK